MSPGTSLDHIAVALERHADGFPRYAGELGGRWVSGGFGFGFSPAQIRFGNGLKVELLRPHAVDMNPFLRRFLDRFGPSAHHLTFKVDDIEATIDQARSLGIEPVDIDLRDPGWMEAFLRPADAQGIVIQMAQADDEWASDPPPGYPPARIDPPADLVRIVHRAADVDGAHRMYETLLEGEPTGDHEFAWKGPVAVKVVEGTPPGVAAVEFALDDPSELLAAIEQPDGTHRIAADDNHGVALVLRARAGS